MKRMLLTALALCALAAGSCSGQSGGKEAEVLLETTAGDIRIRLYNDTPGHRDNFIKNVRAGLYDGVTFHRVIRNFMIQTGDPGTRPGHEAEAAAAAADTAATGPTIPAEVVYPRHFHRRGVVAAAREGDDVNPSKASDAYQFYIVTGKSQSESAMYGYERRKIDERVNALYAKKMKARAAELDGMRRQRDRDGVSRLLEKLLDEAKREVEDNPPAPFTQEQLRAYRTHGGAPWLDGSYTVFGEVVEGMKAVLDIERAKTGAGDRPLRDIRIVRATVLE